MQYFAHQSEVLVRCLVSGRLSAFCALTHIPEKQIYVRCYVRLTSGKFRNLSLPPDLGKERLSVYHPPEHTMASSLHDKNGKPYHNGNGAVGNWYGNGLDDDVGLQPRNPRRLSFNGSDMELSDLKSAAATGNNGNNRNCVSVWEMKIETKKMAGLLVIAMTLAVSIKYLLSSFDFAFFQPITNRSAAAANRLWEHFVQRLAYLKASSTAWSFERMIPQAENVAHILFAVAFGLLVSSFTWYVIYLDSSIPGVNPPTPFSASKKR